MTVNIDHARPADSVLSGYHFSEYSTTLWNGWDELPQWEMVVRAVPSDDAVHGENTVRVNDTVKGVEGRMVGWDRRIAPTHD